jgi:hypothetical protein
MNAANCVTDRARRRDLEEVVEPLASYICATEQPKTALVSALRALLSQVEATNRTAVAHFRTCLEKNWSPPQVCC